MLQFPSPLPHTIKQIQAFATFCHLNLKLFHVTIRAYLAGVPHHLLLKDPSRPTLFFTHLIKAVLKGIHKCQLVKLPLRIPISPDMFKQFVVALNSALLGRFKCLVLKAAMFLAYCGFLRPSKCSKSDSISTILCKRHLVKSADWFTLTLPRPKTQQESGAIINYYPTCNAWCGAP